MDPITAKGGPVHPMAQAMNAIGYDAVALGNHEFNYGIETLRKFEEQLRFPLLGANALDGKTLPAFAPYSSSGCTPGRAAGQGGVLGLTNPGIAIWDKAYVQGKLTFPGWRSRRQVGAEAASHGCGRGDRVGALRLDGSRRTVTSCRTSRTRRRWWRSRCRASTRFWSGTRTWRSRS